MVTAGAPAPQAPRIPARTRVLSLEDRADPVALLGSLINAGAENRLTVVFDGPARADGGRSRTSPAAAPPTPRAPRAGRGAGPARPAGLPGAGEQRASRWNRAVTGPNRGSGQVVDKLGELGEVATLHHRHHLAVAGGGGVAGVPVPAVLGVEPPRVRARPGQVRRTSTRQVAVVGAGVAEDQQRGPGPIASAWVSANVVKARP